MNGNEPGDQLVHVSVILLAATRRLLHPLKIAGPTWFCSVGLFFLNRSWFSLCIARRLHRGTDVGKISGVWLVFYAAHGRDVR